MDLKQFLQECRDKESRATRGPWYSDVGNTESRFNADSRPRRKDQTIVRTADRINGTPSGVCIVFQDKGNGEFIAFSRNSFLKLVRMCEVMDVALRRLAEWELHFEVQSGFESAKFKSVHNSISNPAKEALAQADAIANGERETEGRTESIAAEKQ